MLNPANMMRITVLGSWASFGLLVALVGCSGSATTGGPGGSVAGTGAGGSATAGSGGAGAASNAGSGGVAGHGAGAGNAGTAGGCTEGATMPAGCNTCQCHNGQWACTLIACNTTCGGFVGNTCSATEYCAYMPGQSCGEADASSNCMTRPDSCPDIYMPVCGCDQKTYPSACNANAAGQGLFALGACPTR
ncbi:MAG TPA: Kazal-type serine protease inhibitor domain-containing protein [Polyangiaceae bacterium]|jgi:hypothetical protein|nr:Kazal-type serine protease inhibitor domain-containing protein [Polyangiaceae bacterium]